MQEIKGKEIHHHKNISGIAVISEEELETV